VNEIVALWAVPRSVSTAFERMMRARGDLEVIHEPFSAYYYFSHDRANDNLNKEVPPDPSHHWTAIRDRIAALADERPAFFKDMAYHLSRCMTPDLVARYTNTFLVRDPRETLPSLYRLYPEASLEETGFDQQLRLIELTRAETGADPVVIDAAELLASPEQTVAFYCRQVGLPFVPESLSWEPGTQPGWETWAPWHETTTTATSGFDRDAGTDPVEDEVEVPPGVLEHCLETYERIIAFRRPPRS